MHRIARILAPVIAVAAIAIAGGSTALGAAPTSEDLTDSWCFDDTPWYVYCFEVTGRVEYTDSKPGGAVIIHQKTVTTISQGGVVLGTATDLYNDRFFFGNDGVAVYHTVQNSKSDWLGEQCHYQAVLQIKDFDVTIDHTNSSCGSDEAVAQ
jgi:hypothetical protein